MIANGMFPISAASQEVDDAISDKLVLNPEVQESIESLDTEKMLRRLLGKKTTSEELARWSIVFDAFSKGLAQAAYKADQYFYLGRVQ